MTGNTIIGNRGYVIWLFILTLFVSCDIIEWQEEDDRKEIDILISFYDPDKSQDSTGIAFISTETVEINFQRIRFNSQDKNGTGFRILDTPVIISTFDSDISIARYVLPSDIYHEIDLEIHPDQNQQDSAEPDSMYADEADVEAYALKITGTFDGSEFTYYYNEKLDLKFGLMPPVNFRNPFETIHTFRFMIDYSGWFVSMDNEPLDPAEPLNRTEINDNIYHSFSLDLRQPEVTIADAEAVRSDESIVFTVSLSEEAANEVTVDFETSGQSARAGENFVDTTGTLIFEPGEIDKEIEVELLSATFNAPQRRFRVQLTNPSGVVLRPQNRMAAGIIHNDTTDLPEVVIADAEAGRSDDFIFFTVSLSDEAQDEVTVDFETSGQSAQAGENFVETSGTLIFQPGETEQEIAVELLPATFNAPHRRFRIRLSNPSGALLSPQNNMATGTIIGD